LSKPSHCSNAPRRPRGARFQADGFSIEADADTATFELIPIAEHGQATGYTWTLLSSLDSWTSADCEPGRVGSLVMG
jgi:hypothetical protein